MTKFFAFMAAIALAITFSSCASKEEPASSGSYQQSSASSTYAK